jgi:hypothetical protein
MNNILKNIKKESLGKNERCVIHNLYNFANITPDVYHAFDMFINPKHLELLIKKNNDDSKKENISQELFEYYQKWFKTVASKNQQDVCLYYGILNVTHQMMDKKEITVSEMVEEFQSQHLKEDYSEIKTIALTDAESKRLEIKEREVVNFINLSDLGEELDVIVHESIITTENKPLVYNDKEDLIRKVNILYKLSTRENLCWLSQLEFLIKEFNKINVPLKEMFDNYLVYTNEKMRLNNLGKLKDINNNENAITNIQEKTLVEKEFDLKKEDVIKFGKKSIKKAIKLYKNLFNNNNIELFISGDSFIIEGDLFNYGIKKSSISIMQHTINPVNIHIPYSLEILNKDNVVLCNACVYFQETPIIDQIIALTLHIQSGREGELLKIANFFNKKPAYYNTQYFNEKKSKINEKELEYSYLNELLSNSMEKYFFDFINIKNLPKNISDFQLTWFDEMLESHEMHNKMKHVEKNLTNAVVALDTIKEGDLNV